MIFSARSLAHLDPLHYAIQRVALRAIKTTTQDFAVIDGLRTAVEQDLAFAHHASRLRSTDNPPHMRGIAIDVMACVGDIDHDGDKDENWEPPYYWAIAAAFQEASRFLSIPLIWGAVWDTLLADLPDNLERAALDYLWIRRHGKSLFDVGHFELHLPEGQTT